jgi:hypothetical protein
MSWRQPSSFLRRGGAVTDDAAMSLDGKRVIVIGAAKLFLQTTE